MSEQMERPVPQGVTPYLMVRGASQAAEWYKRAFGAEEVMRMPAEGSDKLMHCHLRINGGDVFMSDEFPEYGASLGEGPRGVTMFLAVDDADRWYNRAVEAGATVRMEIADQFWGDRFGEVVDPYGHGWAFGSPIKKNS
ncbi:MAG TPA: VOC family protein [Longimicrobium sp.]|nr:VOC family protein [Longimicrobium sp.]